MLDINQLNGIINIKRNGNDVVPIEGCYSESLSEQSVTVQTNQEIEQGGTVTNNDGFLVRISRQNLL